MFHANSNQKSAGAVTLISDRIDFKSKSVIRDKEGHYIEISVSPSKRYNNYKHTSKYTKQKWTELKRDFSTSFAKMGKTKRLIRKKRS